MGNYGIFKLNSRILHVKMCAAYPKQHVSGDELFVNKKVGK